MVKSESYLSRLLDETEQINNFDALLVFLKEIDADQVEEKVGAEINDPILTPHNEHFPNYRFYEQEWFNRFILMKRMIISGETNLSRLLSRLYDRMGKKSQEVMQKACFFGKLKKYPREIILPWRVILEKKYLHDNCSPTTDCVIETGSGPALFLVDFWLSGGPLYADYYGLEITQSARLCINIMSCFEPKLKLKSMFFDYHNPDFSELNNRYKDVLVFSRGSIEQVSTLPEAYIENLLPISEKLSCVHIEPVGWQMVEPAKQDKITKKHQLRCKKKGYNENLWELLKKFEENELIAINDYAINFSGKKNHFATYISWTKCSRG